MNEENVKSRLAVFFLITFTISWILWMPSMAYSIGINVPEVLIAFGMTAGFTPSIVGFIMHRMLLGKEEFRKDMKQKFSWQFSKWWLLAIPCYFFLAAGMSYMLLHFLDPDFNIVGKIPLYYTPFVFLQILLLGGAVGEEFGWRGFAYDRMLEIWSPMRATLILGIIWSLWHLPLFFMEGTVQSNLPIWQFILQNTMIGFYYTYLYHRTKGNMWMMIFLHAVANTSAAMFPYWQTNLGRYIGFSLLTIGLLMIYSKDKFLKRA